MKEALIIIYIMIGTGFAMGMAEQDDRRENVRFSERQLFVGRLLLWPAGAGTVLARHNNAILDGYAILKGVANDR